MFANLFIEKINAQLGTDVPMVDLVEVLKNDEGSPEAIAAAGLDVSVCDR